MAMPRETCYKPALAEQVSVSTAGIKSHARSQGMRFRLWAVTLAERLTQRVEFPKIFSWEIVEWTGRECGRIPHGKGVGSYFVLIQ